MRSSIRYALPCTGHRAPLRARRRVQGAASVMLRYLPFLLVLALWIYAFIDCLNTPESQVRGLPKVVWVIIILLFGEVLLGPIAWLVAGRPRQPVDGAG